MNVEKKYLILNVSCNIDPWALVIELKCQKVNQNINNVCDCYQINFQEIPELDSEILIAA